MRNIHFGLVLMSLTLSVFGSEIESETDLPSPDGTTPSTRRTIGVGEIVRFSFANEVHWTATGGDPIDGGLGTSFTWFAPGVPGTYEITAAPNEYSQDPDPKTLTVTVIPPAVIRMERKALRLAYLPGWAGTGFSANVRVEPMSVCFNQIDVREMGAPPFAAGYFSGLAHPHREGRWQPIGDKNESLGWVDEIGIIEPGYPPPPAGTAFSLGLWICRFPPNTNYRPKLGPARNLPACFKHI